MLPSSILAAVWNEATLVSFQLHKPHWWAAHSTRFVLLLGAGWSLGARRRTDFPQCEQYHPSHQTRLPWELTHLRLQNTNFPKSVLGLKAQILPEAKNNVMRAGRDAFLNRTWLQTQEGTET